MIYNPANVGKLSTTFREEIERAAQDGFTLEELDAAKTGRLKARQVSHSTDGALAGQLRSFLHLGRDLRFDAQREEMVRTLTRERVNTTMKTHLDFNRMISVKAGDFKKSAPAKSD